ncbi:hypothetical protein BTH64_02650 [Lactobacillus delbrueckii subsp. bulgaricus]|nr:hypothetical protein [Lactobacillus delbrueckii subsp. bulgaricus]MBT8892618.1 hypothetical protein [Lactobacillus delbrueckii subsp. bulgaricus]
MHQIENADFLAHLVCQSFFKKIAGKSGKTKRRASQALRVLNNLSYLDIWEFWSAPSFPVQAK